MRALAITQSYTVLIYRSGKQAPNSQVVDAIRINCGDLTVGIAKFQQPSSKTLSYAENSENTENTENTFTARSNI